MLCDELLQLWKPGAIASGFMSVEKENFVRKIIE